MNYKTQQIERDLTQRLSRLPAVHTIVLAETISEDILDPYCFISLDVYYTGILPDTRIRYKLFEDAGAFESSILSNKDRFFIQELPVRVEYKNSDHINATVLNFGDNLWDFRQNGTYMFYRIVHGTLLYNQDCWFQDIKQKVDELPDKFWQLLADAFLSVTEHCLSDIYSSIYHNDNYFFIVSLAGFMKGITSLLFSVNKTLEPSGRLVMEKIYTLGFLPENFKGRFETLISDDKEFSPERKGEVAELLTKSVLHIV